MGWLINERCIIQKDGSPRPGASELLGRFQTAEIPYLVLSDQSLLTRERYCRRLNMKGLTSLHKEDLYTSSMAAVDYCVSRWPSFRQAGYIGAQGIREALRQGGYEMDRQSADIVLIGMDRNAAYSDYCYILKLLQNGAELISTDQTPYEEKEDGSFLIGNGAVVSMFEKASGKKALEFGSPSDLFLMQAARYLGEESGISLLTCSLKETAYGHHLGYGTVFVTSLMDENTDLFQAEIKPDFVVEDLNGLLQ